MAHLREIVIPKCGRCERRAKLILYNRANAPQGAYCKRCAPVELTTLLLKERQRDT